MKFATTAALFASTALTFRTSFIQHHSIITPD